MRNKTILTEKLEMRKRAAYNFTFDGSQVRFEFDSIGPKGKLRKVVEFTDLKFAYNLAFGDKVDKEEYDDVNISDNGDMREVLQTIANIIHHFFEKRPYARIYIEPIDAKRRSLYNRIFKEKHEEIIACFQVTGIDLKSIAAENYKPTKNYDAFIIQKIL